MLNIIIKGRIPSKKNSKIMICRGKYPILISNPKFQSWNTEQLWLLKRFKTSQSIEKCDIRITFHAPDKRAADLSNKAESLMDLLVEAGIIKDDNWFVVNSLNLEFGGVDVEDPRAEINIKEKALPKR